MTMRKFLLILSLAALPGSNTVDRIGQDISGGANRVAGRLG